jgi:hypothetical protein
MIRDTLVFGLMLLALCQPVAAIFVQPGDAALAARAWAQNLPGNNNASFEPEQIQYFTGKGFKTCPETFTKGNADNPRLFLMTFANGAFSLVSADDNAVPVLAYSSASSAKLDSYPPSFIEWVDLYDRQVRDITDAKIVIPSNRQQWQDLLSGQAALPSRLDRSVQPLMALNWDQGWPYNELCPVDQAGPGGHVYAGCVATAMGMVMKYWNHPTTGVGSNNYYAVGYGYQNANFGATTYLWDEMPNSVGSSNLPVATLLYHCGVAVEMDYAPDGSGAQSADAATAMAVNFRYPNAELQSRMGYSDANWNALLQAQLDNASPMYYSGSGTGGHAFVIDGYETTGYYHFNFGWSGSYNGYYYMNAINPGGSSFNEWNAAIVNSIPENYTIGNTRIRMNAVAPTVGNDFNLTVSTNPVLGSWNVNHYSFTLFYDHNYLDFTGATVANTIASEGTLTVSESEPGNLVVSWDGPSDLIGAGDLAVFSFTPLDSGEFLFDILGMQYNSTPVTNTEYLMVTVDAPVETLAQTSISMLNVMHLGYEQIGTTEVRTTYLLPSWNVEHYDFTLSYDPTRLQWIGLDTEGTLSAGLEPSVVLNYPGNVYITCDMDDHLTGSGALVKASFMAIGNGSSIVVTQVTPGDFHYNDTLITSTGSANFILSPVTDVQDEVVAAIPCLSIHPNPIACDARISFSGKSGEPASLKVYNLKGQLVSTLSLPAAGTDIVWNASDASGQRLAAGIYLYKWQQGQQTGSGRILIVK